MSVPVKQAIPINFSGDLDTKSDPWQINASEFLALNNMIRTTGGRLSKRNGFPSYSKTINTPPVTLTYSNVGGTLTAGRKIFSYNNELLASDAFNLYSWDAGNSAWNYKGRQTQVSLTTSSVVANSTIWLQCDSSIDTTSGIKVFAYGTAAGGTVRYSIQDTVTGQFIVNQALMGTVGLYKNPRCVSISGKSWILAVNTSDGKIYYQAIVGQVVTGSPTALITDLHASGSYDVDVDSYTGNIYIAYYNASPGVTITALSSTMTIGNTIAQIGADGSVAVSWFGDGTHIWVAYASATVVKTFVVNNAVSSTTVSPTTIDSTAAAGGVNNVTGVWSSTQSKAFFFYDPYAVNGGGQLTAAVINFNSATISGATVTPGTPNLFMGSLILNSKAFTVSGIPHVVGWFGFGTLEGSSNALNIIQPTNFLLNLYNVTPTMGGATNNDVIANIAGKISPDQAQASVPVSGLLAGVHQNASGAWELALLQNVNYGQGSVVFIAPTGVIDCQFDFSLTNPDAISLGNNAIFAGSQVSMYDGASVVEQNFHIYPSAIAYSLGAAGAMGLASADSLYSWIFTYEWIDNQGQLHRSFPAPALTAIAAGHTYTFASGTTNGSAAFTIRTLRVTNKGGAQVQIVGYRTLANGSVYYRSGSVLNDPAAATVTFTDSLSDILIQGNIQLYTTGAQGYYAPPATSSLSSFKNRAMGVASEDPYQIGYSNQVQQNFPVQFVPFFLQNIGTTGGPLVTTANMDDKLIIFKSGTISGPAIWYLVGQGPAPSGSGNDFGDPLPIAVDAGCVDRESVVLTPVGLMFKSSKGIYLIDRGLQVSYIGAPVALYNSYSVVSAQLIPGTTEVRFLLAAAAPVSMLIYDYFYKKWSTSTAPAGISDCIFQGKHTYLASDGTVYQESAGTYYDGVNAPVLQSFTTAWIKLSALQSYQAAYFFYLLGQWGTGNSSIAMTLNYDFGDLPAVTMPTIPNGTNFLNWRVFHTQRRCQSFQIVLSEVSGGTLGSGFVLSGINAICGLKGPFRSIAASNSTG